MTIYTYDELYVSNWSQWDPNNYLIDKKFIKKMSKKYLNIMKSLKLDQIHACEELNINNCSLGDPNKNSNWWKINQKNI